MSGHVFVCPPPFPLSGCVFTFSCAITVKWVDVYMLKLTLEFAYSSSFTCMIAVCVSIELMIHNIHFENFKSRERVRILKVTMVHVK